MDFEILLCHVMMLSSHYHVIVIASYVVYKKWFLLAGCYSRPPSLNGKPFGMSGLNSSASAPDEKAIRCGPKGCPASVNSRHVETGSLNRLIIVLFALVFCFQPLEYWICSFRWKSSIL